MAEDKDKDDFDKTLAFLDRLLQKKKEQQIAAEPPSTIVNCEMQDHKCVLHVRGSEESILQLLLVCLQQLDRKFEQPPGTCLKVLAEMSEHTQVTTISIGPQFEHNAPEPLITE